jgi:hypothetical protein
MSTPPHLDERSIFSYPPPLYKPTAKEIASKKIDINKITNDEDIKKESTNIIDCPSEIHCTLPDGMKVGKHPIVDEQENWGLYATKLFPRHSVVFIDKFYNYIYDKDVDYKVIIDPNGKYFISLRFFYYSKSYFKIVLFFNLFGMNCRSHSNIKYCSTFISYYKRYISIIDIWGIDQP